MKSLHWKRAALMVIVGAALFFMGCQPKVPVKPEFEEKEPASDLFRTVEVYLEAGQHEKALLLLKSVPEKYPDYASQARYKMASIYLEQNEFEHAQREALSLVQSTTEESWALPGRQLLERIQSEMLVKKEVLGCLLPLSGPFAIYGEEVLNGIQLGLGMFDSPGQEPAVELVIKDTKGEPGTAMAALEDLVDNENVIAVIGPLSSRAAVAAAQKAQEFGVPMITLTQKDKITETGDMVFRNFLTPLQEVKWLLDTVISEIGIERFGVLYPDNSYGRFLANLFWEKLEEKGGIVTAIEPYNTDDTDFAKPIKKMTGLYYPKPYSLVQKLKEMRPPEQEESELEPEKPEAVIDFDAVFIPDNFENVAMIAPQLAYNDVTDILLIGTSLWQSPELVELAKDYVQGSIFSSGFFEKSGEPGVDAFINAYRTNFNLTPGVLGATGYDTIRFLKSVIADEGIHTRTGFREALINYQDFEGVTGRTFFSSQGEVEKEPLLLTVSGKRMKVLYIN
ncbi:MAG: ABC transporter substrate-binding protein [Desulfobacterales bacterium]|nr:ABC transporter substrate-binding protein [Desulfobacterales bacterium]